MTAYTGDLAEESDQAKVTLGGIIQTSRRVVTRAGSTMLVATLEDLQGSVEVVVFPKVFAETANAWADDTMVLVSGRVDHRDEAAQILCEAVHAWEDAARMGPVAYGAERDRLLRSRGADPGRRRPPAPTATGTAARRSPHRHPAEATSVRPRGAISVMPAPSTAAAIPVEPAPAMPTPLAEPSEETPAPADAVPLVGHAHGGWGDPDRLRGGDRDERLLPAIESVTQAVRDRPGSLPVVITIPVAGATREVRLPHRAEWNDRLAESVRQAAGVPGRDRAAG